MDLKELPHVLRHCGRVDKRADNWLKDHPLTDNSDNRAIALERIITQFQEVYDKSWYLNAMVHNTDFAFKIYNERKFKEYTLPDVADEIIDKISSIRTISLGELEKLYPNLVKYLDIVNKYFKTGEDPLLLVLEA